MSKKRQVWPSSYGAQRDAFVIVMPVKRTLNLVQLEEVSWLTHETWRLATGTCPDCTMAPPLVRKIAVANMAYGARASGSQLPIAGASELGAVLAIEPWVVKHFHAPHASPCFVLDGESLVV